MRGSLLIWLDQDTAWFVGGINHDRLRFGGLRGQPLHDTSKDAHIAPPLPTAVKRLRGTILSGIVPPVQSRHLVDRI